MKWRKPETARQKERRINGVKDGAKRRARGKGRHASLKKRREEEKRKDGVKVGRAKGVSEGKKEEGKRRDEGAGRGCEESKPERENTERDDAADAEQKLSPSPSGFAAARRGAFHPPFEPRATHHPRRRSLRPSRATTKPPTLTPGSMSQCICSRKQRPRSAFETPP